MSARKPTSLVPTRCIERHPHSKRGVRFAGVIINLSMLSRSFDPPISVAQLSRVLNRKQDGSVALCRLIAQGLGMQLQAFLDELERMDEEREAISTVGHSPEMHI